MLHGFGGYLNQFNSFMPLLQETNIIYVAPQAPYPFEYSSRPFTSFSWNIFDMEDRSYMVNSGFLTVNYILKLVEKLREEYNVKSVYLAGFSQGGWMTLSIGIRNSDVFDGLISFGGGIWEGLIPDYVIAEGSNVPIMMIHGNQYPPERKVGFTWTLATLTGAGYDVTYHVFEGGHEVPREEFQRMIEWIISN
jgi:predicted esterase